MTFEDCLIDNSALSSVPGALFNHGCTGANVRITVRNVTRLIANPGPLFSYVGTANHVYVAENCVGFDQFGTFAGLFGKWATLGARDIGHVLMQNIGGDRDFRIEAWNYLIDWFSAQGYPTLNSYLPSGNKWSYRFYWSGSTNVVQTFDHLTLLALTKTNLLESDERTITLELAVDDDYADDILDTSLELQVTYVRASDDAVMNQSSLDNFHDVFMGNGSPIPASSASWTLNSFGGYVARKLEVTTLYPIKTGTEVEARLIVHTPAPESYLFVFINPELGIA
jgi:hypothetical protein